MREAKRRRFSETALVVLEPTSRRRDETRSVD
jgi:hypothetical protein